MIFAEIEENRGLFPKISKIEENRGIEDLWEACMFTPLDNKYINT